MYGGAAGGGKSYFIRWAAILWGFYLHERYGVNGVNIGLFCEDYPTLKDRQITKIKTEVPPEVGRLIETRDEGYIFESANREFRILLRNLDDPSKYASVEFASIFVDELTKNPAETFDDLRFRMRYPGVPFPKFVAGTNPGSVGHAWVKKLWIAPDIKHPDPEQSMFKYIPSSVYDNKYIDLSYVDQLKSLPEQKRRAFLEGSWDIFAGQVFDEWRTVSHVVEPFEVPKHWKRYIAMDWGSNKPFAVGWFAQDEDGRSYMYRELYMNSQEFEQEFGKPLTAKRLARVILSINRNAKEIYEYMVCDPSMWNKILLGEKTSITQGESYAEVMINQGLRMVRADNDRINGLGRFREALSIAPDGKPWFQVFKTCYNTIETIPALVYDKVRVEDVDSDGPDHAYDMARYYFMSRPYETPEVPKPESQVRRHYEQLKSRRYGESQFEESY